MSPSIARSTFVLPFVLSLFLVGASGEASAQVRMIELDEISQEITIKNFSGGTTVDISGYFMCRAPGTYQQMTALTIISGGDLNLSPGEEVTVVYGAVLSTGTGIGLYLNGSGFANSANMADYMQYKGVVGVREPVAVAAGIWAASTFASGDPGPYFYSGDGTQNGAAFWSSTPPPSVPALGNLGALLMIAIVIGSAGFHRRRGARA